VPLCVIGCLHQARRQRLSAVDAASLTPCPQPKKRQLANTPFGPAEQSRGQARRHPIGRQPGGYCQDVELHQLEAFVAVATELHFGPAAERLHIAAPKLSELIRRLERELGTPLFTRTTRHVALTSAGAEFHPAGTFG
jgi:Bacterial regulatory helix-turn-helix protein, lysR family